MKFEFVFCLYNIMLAHTLEHRSKMFSSNPPYNTVAVKGAGISDFDSSDDSQPGRMQSQQSHMSMYQSQPTQQMMYGQVNRQSQHGMQQIISQQHHNQHCDDNESDFRVKILLVDDLAAIYDKKTFSHRLVTLWLIVQSWFTIGLTSGESTIKIYCKSTSRLLRMERRCTRTFRR